ncbi:shikimate dehydrogenase [Gaopeijia maritima]|uniref:shikimate dehydrogenase family protein n=1 Tax=Gaopeijia maritima TaxID=3119007 RepID=UPI0032437FBB
MTGRPISAATRLFAVLGDPVAHSLSPALHGAALAARRLDAVYLALRCGDRDAVGLVRGLALAGGGGNVTVPHKRRAAEAVDRRTPAVERTGACNTFWSDDGAVWGDNTDVAGFRGAVTALLPEGVAGARVLLLGAGGAARAALAGLLDDGVREVAILNRSVDRARELIRGMGAEGSATALDGEGALSGEDFDLVVQATSLGLHPSDPLPTSLDRCRGVGAALDLVYGREPTRWVRAARERGVPAADGREMLLLQATAAFRRWFGDPVPMAEMRAALNERDG